jgi:hypothetical protein
MAGLALAGSAAMNPFVGGIFALAYGTTVAIDAWGRPAPLKRIAAHAVAAVPVALVLGWSIMNQMVEGAGGALQIGFSGASRHWPLVSLVLSVGPMLLVASAGLWPATRLPFAPARPFLVLAILSLLLLYFVRLSVDEAWVGFRAGQMLLVALAALAARFIARGWTDGRKAVVAGVAGVALLAGLPTTVIDEYNARDIHNVSMGPGFPWTVVITPPQRHALEWIRAETPADAVVQMDPTVRERSTWSLVPSFGERRMAAGLPISLLDVPEYHERSQRVRAMYDTPNAVEASEIARSLRIDFIYVDAVERAAHPAGVRFGAAPDLFEPVFRESDAAVYRVR